MKDKTISEMDIRIPVSQNVIRLVLTGLLFAAAIVLSIAEDALRLPVPAPGVKLGLSNIVVMYSLFFLGKREALLLVVLKSLFVFVTRGLVASILSFCGGMLSVAVMILLLVIFRERISYFLLSIAGSVFHNLGQLAAVSLIYTNLLVILYLPILLISGVLTGIATSALLRVFIPALKRLGLK